MILRPATALCLACALLAAGAGADDGDPLVGTWDCRHESAEDRVTERMEFTASGRFTGTVETVQTTEDRPFAIAFTHAGDWFRNGRELRLTRRNVTVTSLRRAGQEVIGTEAGNDTARRIGRVFLRERPRPKITEMTPDTLVLTEGGTSTRCTRHAPQ
ncbi:hypothetical protein SAMN04490248_11468 [Salinihabitans flavidus]|uniref:Uncharacterized protein n=1 Tax=Salinihabitans flavidus TaxID=569882 RepID=A0A1H8T6E6_9RHOB|nr:hypothetical protein [Salinihabitans flavidus]SEO86511.1 hypothetical protein SAMN04490248_11468 [Salinihabitans flavidus]